MPSQERFEELVSLAQQGNLELMNAIRIAQHESFKERVEETVGLLKVIKECQVFFSEHPNPQSEELLKKCTREINNVKSRLEETEDLLFQPVEINTEEELIL